MSQKQLAFALMGVGAVVAVIGLLLWLGSGTDAPPLAQGSTTTIATGTTGSAGPETTQGPFITTTSLVSTTTSVAPTTTTTLDPAVSIAEFVPEFASAIERGDVDQLYETLHPAVSVLFGAEQCRQFIENEILLLVDYRLVGEVEGPDPQDVGGATVDVYRAPVAFGFQGQEFESQAGFALVDGEVRWFSTCE